MHYNNEDVTDENDNGDSENDTVNGKDYNAISDEINEMHLCKCNYSVMKDRRSSPLLP